MGTELTMDAESVKKLTCFVISSLIKNNLYAYGAYLEQIFHALLLSTDFEFESNAKDLQQISKLIPDIVRKEFMRICFEKKVLKLDQISDGMKALFIKNSVLCLDKIYKFMPNLEELHLYESHDVNDEFITAIIEYIKCHRDVPLNTIKSFKYSFKGSSEQFQFAKSISASNKAKLSSLGWGINEVYADNFYKFVLKKNK